jgi:hypothetical protein
VVSFTSRSLYPGGKSIRCLLDTSLDGPQSRFGRSSEEIKSLSCRKLNPGLPSLSHVTILTAFKRSCVAVVMSQIEIFCVIVMLKCNAVPLKKLVG